MGKKTEIIPITSADESQHKNLQNTEMKPNAESVHFVLKVALNNIVQ